MKLKFVNALSLALIVAMLLTSLVLADTVSSDVDFVNSGNETLINLGTVAPNQVVNTSASFQLVCSGKNHADQGNTVLVNYFSAAVPAGSLTAGNVTIGPIPAEWADDNGDCASPAPVWNDNGNSAVSITAPAAAGTYDYVVTYKVCQSNNASLCGGIDPNDVTGAIDPVTFRLTVVSDTTPPVITKTVTGTLGNNGWYTSDVVVDWTVSDPDSSFTTVGCVDTTIHNDTSGTTSNCSATSAGGTSSDSVTIKRDASAPSISATPDPAANANGWNNTDVTVSYSCSDNGPSGVDAAASDLADDLLTASGTASGTCVDLAGNSANDSYTAQIDNVKPLISGSRTPAANANGWNNTNVVVSFSCTDSGGSGIDTDTVAGATVSTEGAGQSVTSTGSCTDKAGNTADPATVSEISIDKTAPMISASRTPLANANGWNNTDVASSYAASDGLSGLDLSSPATGSFTFTAEGAGQSHTFTVTDLAGNSASAIVSGVKIDKTSPVLNITGAAGGTSSVCSALPSQPTFAPSDALSGLDGTEGDSWATPSNPSGVGTYTYSAHATDLAGNSASDTRTYTVNYNGAFSGYLQPINTDGSSRFKLGSTIPVKFQLTCNGVALSNAVAKLYVAKGDNMPDPGIDEAISTAASTTGNLFRYDATAQQYIFNLSTKLGYTNPGGGSVSFSTGSWTLKILLDDGQWYSVNVQLPR